MTISATAKSRIYVGTTLQHAAVDAEDFEADTFVEIGEVSDLGTFGVEAAELSFKSISDDWTRRRRGTRDAGTIELICGRDAQDAGQIALKAAMNNALAHNFKVTLNDRAEVDGQDSYFYFRGVVLSDRGQYGEGDTISMATYRIGIDGALIEIPADGPPVFAPVAGALDPGTEDVAYAEVVAATGGLGAPAYTVLSGTLPTGVTLNGATGAIEGTPTVAGTYNFVIRATFAIRGQADAAYSIVISA